MGLQIVQRSLQGLLSGKRSGERAANLIEIIADVGSPLEQVRPFVGKGGKLMDGLEIPEGSLLGVEANPSRLQLFFQERRRWIAKCVLLQLEEFRQQYLGRLLG